MPWIHWTAGDGSDNCSKLRTVTLGDCGYVRVPPPCRSPFAEQRHGGRVRPASLTVICIRLRCIDFIWITIAGRQRLAIKLTQSRTRSGRPGGFAGSRCPVQFRVGSRCLRYATKQTHRATFNPFSTTRSHESATGRPETTCTSPVSMIESSNGAASPRGESDTAMQRAREGSRVMPTIRLANSRAYQPDSQRVIAASVCKKSSNPRLQSTMLGRVPRPDESPRGRFDETEGCDREYPTRPWMLASRRDLL